MSKEESPAKRAAVPLLRPQLEEREARFLAPQACLSAQSRGRVRPETDCPLRTAFQRDRDRIVHCKSFRRLKHKTQVFLSPNGDHYRTRLTHTLEVSQIARTISRALALNEDLVEAIALAHDLGHTAFGHSGERVLNEIVPEGFSHNEQSLRVIEHLEKDGRGLNLTVEVRDGVLKHSKGRTSPVAAEKDRRPITLEGEVVRIADIVAYLNHDLDDALRAEILRPEDIPADIRESVGVRHAQRIHTLVGDIIYTSLESDLSEIRPSPEMLVLVERLRDFLFERVYDAPQVRIEFERVRKIMIDLCEVLMRDDDLFRRELGCEHAEDSRARRVFDYIAGMTDRYALDLYKRVFLPRPWMKL